LDVGEKTELGVKGAAMPVAGGDLDSTAVPGILRSRDVKFFQEIGSEI
jgi:hypothetical protein